MRTNISGRLAVIAATTAIAAVPAVATATPVAPVTAHATKTCSTGYRHARINAVEKCLRVGQFCAHRYDHRAPHRYSYRHYSFACKKRDARGNYHLTYR